MPDDLAVARPALRQHGNVTREQLLALGFNSSAINYRVKTGRLYRVHRGVYAVGRPPKTALERACAAVLACGPGAVLSHRSALALWDLGNWGFGFEVSVGSDRRPKGIRTHLCGKLRPRDCRLRDGIRVTSPGRTLLDCAPGLNQKALARAVNEALRRRLVRRSELADVIEYFPYHPGRRRMARFANAKGGPTRSGWEDDFPAFCRRFGLPEPVMAATVAGWEVDALFPDEKVIVELDGWDFHSSRESFESDRERDASTLAAGHVTVRVTWERMHKRAAHEAARLETILKQRRSQAA